MATFTAALRMEIRRLAAKDVQRALRHVRRVRRQLQALRIANRGQRRTIANLDRKLTKLQEKVRLHGRGMRRGAAADGRPRIQPAEIHSIRKRLGLSRLKFAKILSVSPGSIFGWEHGRTQPRIESVRRLRALEKRQAPGRSAMKKKRRTRRVRTAGRKRSGQKTRRRR